MRQYDPENPQINEPRGIIAEQIERSFSQFAKSTFSVGIKYQIDGNNLPIFSSDDYGEELKREGLKVEKLKSLIGKHYLENDILETKSIIMGDYFKGFQILHDEIEPKPKGYQSLNISSIKNSIASIVSIDDDLSTLKHISDNICKKCLKEIRSLNVWENQDSPLSNSIYTW